MSKAHISVLKKKGGGKWGKYISRERVSYKVFGLVTVAKETTSLVSARSSHLSLLLCLALRKSCNDVRRHGGNKIMFQSKG